MSVVLPAPLAPTRPWTSPRGIARLTELSAVLPAKRRVRSDTATMGSGTCEAPGERVAVERAHAWRSAAGGAGRRHGRGRGRLLAASDDEVPARAAAGSAPPEVAPVRGEPV